MRLGSSKEIALILALAVGAMIVAGVTTGLVGPDESPTNPNQIAVGQEYNCVGSETERCYATIDLDLKGDADTVYVKVIPSSGEPYRKELAETGDTIRLKDIQRETRIEVWVVSGDNEFLFTEVPAEPDLQG